MTGVGFKEIGRANVDYDTLDNTGRFHIGSKWDFNRYDDPRELLRIAIFDVHVNNMDRNEMNYNILVKYGSKKNLFAIDHFATFGGTQWRGSIDPDRMEAETGNKLLTSPFFRQMAKHFPDGTFKKELDDYFYLCNDELKALARETFDRLPTDWSPSGDLKERVPFFLTHDERNQNAREKLEESLNRIV